MIHHRCTRQQQEQGHERKGRDEEVINQDDQLRRHKMTTTQQQETGTSSFGWCTGSIRRMMSKTKILLSILVVVVLLVLVSVSRSYRLPTFEEGRQFFSFGKNEPHNKHPRVFVTESLEDMVDRMVQLSSSDSTTKADRPPQRQSTQYKHHGDLNNSLLLSSWPRCALNFYGLPRAFSRIVLPSIVRNILIPNARYQCDVYVNFHALKQEASGRSGHGGSLDLDSVHLIRQAVHRVHEKFQQQQHKWTHKQRPSSTGSPPPPRVVIANFTNAEIEQQRDALLTKIRTTLHPKTNRSLYVPWAAGFTLETTYNVVRMWHAIQGVWDLMMMVTTTTEATIHPYYQRVAMFRIDVFYATPIDIFQYNSNRSTPLLSSSNNNNKNNKSRNLSHPTSTTIQGRIYDVDNRVAVIPGFARYPVNDRMMYGPFDAVQVYATRRFELMPRLRERHGLDGLHPETFLQRVVFPEILQLNDANSTRRSSSSQPQQRQRPPLSIYEDDSICFVRARADESVWINDCTRGPSRAGAGGEVRNKNIVKETLTQLQLVVGGRCTKKNFEKRISPNVTIRGVLQATCQ